MRANVETIKINGYKFTMEMDTGGEYPIEYTCWITKDGEHIASREFGERYSDTHFKNFCKKFADDADYRKKYMY